VQRRAARIFAGIEMTASTRSRAGCWGWVAGPAAAPQAGGNNGGIPVRRACLLRGLLSACADACNPKCTRVCAVACRWARCAWARVAFLRCAAANVVVVALCWIASDPSARPSLSRQELRGEPGTGAYSSDTAPPAAVVPIGGGGRSSGGGSAGGSGASSSAAADPGSDGGRHRGGE
jgi:hypothetical protein